ncbi:Rab-family small GTPase (macronuclear) [Tetrahymena thermophila SB210]|uniref:Rab-family small GTPase n=2 Tax=Tetrahymena thermophila TaxID=5911 RepID=I7MIC6_TETTS|nr:Rab-family small GTPase [Tetrahymena thermophila SB210]EAR92890.1 Rab-family small GTPase [Tetrahymena thermophila SB210]BAJ21310.1 Rab-family small GTPase RabX4 [Tetrahymena thermophila]|eukprot:XP_001013135.1 Rab-family small GTPase [Tetrahymena thermophila SB210]
MKSQTKKVKLLILGESSVGKTALLNRFAQNEFIPTSSSTGMDYAIKMIEIDNKKVQLSVWDTAGQERYRSITFNLYKDSQGILLVFDLTNAKTFQTLEKWMQLIKANINEGFQIALIGTKCDLTDQIVVNRDMINEFLDKYDFQFEYFETSSLTNINISECFIHLATKVFRANEELYLTLIAQGIDPEGNTASILLNGNQHNKKKNKEKDKKCCE